MSLGEFFFLPLMTTSAGEPFTANCFASLAAVGGRGGGGNGGSWEGAASVTGCNIYSLPAAQGTSGFQARSKDQEILEEGGGAGPSS